MSFYPVITLSLLYPCHIKHRQLLQSIDFVKIYLSLKMNFLSEHFYICHLSYPNKLCSRPAVQVLSCFFQKALHKVSCNLLNIMYHHILKNIYYFQTMSLFQEILIHYTPHMNQHSAIPVAYLSFSDLHIYQTTPYQQHKYFFQMLFLSILRYY